MSESDFDRARAILLDHYQAGSSEDGHHMFQTLMADYLLQEAPESAQEDYQIRDEWLTIDQFDIQTKNYDVDDLTEHLQHVYEEVCMIDEHGVRTILVDSEDDADQMDVDEQTADEQDSETQENDVYDGQAVDASEARTYVGRQRRRGCRRAVMGSLTMSMAVTMMSRMRMVTNC